MSIHRYKDLAPESAELTSRRALLIFVALLWAVMAMTVLYLSMRDIMEVGGMCAEGGAYQIRVHCPKNSAAMVPLSIVTGMIAAMVYGVVSITGGPNIVVLFWPGLFFSLGLNFLEFGIYPPVGDELVYSWIFCAVLFFLMGSPPLFALGAKGLIYSFLGDKPQPGGKQTIPPGSLAILRGINILTPALGIFAGIFLYATLS